MDQKNHTPNLASQLGRIITVCGIARDAKGGAVVVLTSNQPIYIEKLDSWSLEIAGTLISVTGRLQEKKYIPDPVMAPDGAISQGALGNQYVLECAEWKRITHKKENKEETECN